MNPSEPLFELTHTRVASQRERMEECAQLGICPFCWEHLAKYHDAPILYQGKFWVITANDHPYPGTTHHYLAIYKDHIDHAQHISTGAGDELFTLFGKFCNEYDVRGASIFMRTGNMKHTGATVFHLHAHIIVGVSRDEIPEPDLMSSWIMVKAGYKTRS